jgi:Ser/Thr protein kinase RdoA (MazF antagonist)
VPDDDHVRSLLRDHWHLMTADLQRITGGMLSQAWDVAVGDDRYVARLVDAAGRQPLEAGLAAALQLRGSGVEAGQPVRTLGGGLTAATSCGALALLRRVPGRVLVGRDPVDQQFWGDRLGALHRTLQGFHHPGLRPWNLLDPDAAHLAAEPWLRPAVAEAVTATTRLTVTDRLTYGVLHGDPAAEDFVVDPATGRAGLLDCGASGTGPLIYDVAAAVVYAGGPDQSVELLDGYLAASPVGQDELDAALPVLLRFRWAVQADWSARQLAAGGRDGARECLHRAREALQSLAG